MVQQIQVPGTNEIIGVPDGVPPDQFDAYIADWRKNVQGVTEQSAAGSIYDSIKGAIQGEQDPRYKDTPDYTEFARGAKPGIEVQRPNMLPGFQPDNMSDYDPAFRPGAVDLTMPDDDRLANVLKNNLGERFRGITKDANGYPIITFIDQNGQEQTAYVNKPGLDYNDVQRGVSGSLPFMVAGGVAGQVAKGMGAAGKGVMPLLTRMGLQSSTAADTSVAQDVLGYAGGTEDAVPDLNKAMWAGIGGAGGEALTAAGGKVFDWFKQRSLFKGGKLTDKGRQIATENGIDVDKMDAELARQWARDRVQSQNPRWADNRARIESQGLKGTVGDYTEDVEQQILESNMENRRLGQEAYDRMQQFRREQGKGVETASNDFSVENFGHPREVPAESGRNIQEGIRTKYQQGQADVNKAFSEVDRTRLQPDKIDRQILGQYYKELEHDSPEVYRRLVEIDKGTQPNAFAARQLLEKVISGRAKQSGSRLMGTKAGEPLDWNAIRRRISTYRDRAYASGNASDYKAAKDITDRYNEFLVHLGQNAPDTSDALKLMEAVDMHRQLQQTFRGDDPVGKFMRELTQAADVTPEGIVAKIMKESGKSGTNSVPIVRRLKQVLGENSPEWALIRATAFDNLVSGGKPGVLPADKVAANAKTLLTRSSVYSELFDAKELAKIEEFMTQIGRIGKKDLPPKMQSKEMSELQRVRKDGMLRYIFRRMGTRETFQGRPFKGAIWHMLARSQFTGPVYNFKEAGSTRLAERAIRGGLPTKKSGRGLGPAGAAAGAQYGQNGGSGW